MEGREVKDEGEKRVEMGKMERFKGQTGAGGKKKSGEKERRKCTWEGGVSRMND